jgi:hypothetical protein
MTSTAHYQVEVTTGLYHAKHYPSAVEYFLSTPAAKKIALFDENGQQICFVEKEWLKQDSRKCGLDHAAYKAKLAKRLAPLRVLGAQLGLKTA